VTRVALAVAVPRALTSREMSQTAEEMAVEGPEKTQDWEMVARPPSVLVP
jgi:hypothetical protein